MRFLRSDKGFAMPLVLIVMVVLLLLGAALWHYSISELRQVANEEDQAKAFYVARAGAEAMALHIKMNPSVVDDILVDEEINISAEVPLGNEFLGVAGNVSVLLKKLDGDKFEVTGIGVTNGIKQSVSIVLELKNFPAPDAVVVTTGTQQIEFDSGMTVKGSIVAAGNIIVPTNYDGVVVDYGDEVPENGGQYLATARYPFPDDYFKRVVVPDNPDHYEESRTIGSGQEHVVPDGEHHEFGELTVNNGGTLKFFAAEGSTTIIVVEKLYLNNKSELEIVGSGTVQFYIRKSAMMHSPKITYPPNAQIHFYLAEGCNDFTLNGNVKFDGLIYGPYNTHVKMQSNTEINGALIVDKLSGMGGTNKIGANKAALEYYAGFGEIGFLPIVNQLHWKP